MTFFLDVIRYLSSANITPNRLNIAPHIFGARDALKNNIYSVIAMAFMFLAVQLIALTIAPLYHTAQTEALGGREPEVITNPFWSLLYLGIILGFTFVILWIAKKKKERFIRVLILFAIFMTMTYLFVPLAISVIYPSEGGGWEYNEIGYDVVALDAGDIDNDGVIEILAGCADNKLRIYESENHALEWESEAFPANTSQIGISDVDFDGSEDIIVLSQGIQVLDGNSKSMKWNLTFADFTSIAFGDIYLNGSSTLIAGTDDAHVFVFMSESIYYDYNLAGNLDNITYLNVMDDQRIVASDGTRVVLFDTVATDVVPDLVITNMEDIRALAVHSGSPIEEGIIAANNTWVHLYNLSSEEYARRSEEKLTSFIKSPEISGVYLDYFDIPGCDDDIPDTVVFGERIIIIFPDLLDNEKTYYWLEFRTDLLAFQSTDFEGDGVREWIVGVEDGYIYTSIEFGERPNYAIPFVIAIICALSLTLLVHKFPEWYVVDVVGVVMAIGAVVILGVTFAILPAVVLLMILAVYDAISVYKTKHMISLADSVIELNLPVLLVIPKKLGYSYRQEKPRLKEQLESGQEREAMFMGLGDIVIPSLLVVSSLAFLPVKTGFMGIGTNMLVAFGTMIGILCGFSVLMRYVMKGNPQAGLPLLNSGALIGYFVTYFLIYQDFGFGFNFNF
jgi:presenilin-like A22 family membrane protease